MLSFIQAKTLAMKLFKTFYQTARQFVMDIVLNKKNPKPLWFGFFKWRRRWDSNPRYARTYDGFQDRSNQPLWHSSKVIQLVTETILHKTKFFVKGVG